MWFTYLANRSQCKCNCILYPPLWCIVAMINAYNSIGYALRVSGVLGKSFRRKFRSFQPSASFLRTFAKFIFARGSKIPKKMFAKFRIFSWKFSFAGNPNCPATGKPSFHLMYCVCRIPFYSKLRSRMIKLVKIAKFSVNNFEQIWIILDFFFKFCPRLKYLQYNFISMRMQYCAFCIVLFHLLL